MEEKQSDIHNHIMDIEEQESILKSQEDQSEVTKLKQIVKTIDPKAFVIVTNATEVLGEGFNRTNP